MKILINKFLLILKEKGSKSALIKLQEYIINKKLHIPKQSIKSSDFGSINHYPFVSIIAVNFNGSNDLPTFLESVSKQSYRNFELIIIDNGSKDNSREIVEEFKSRFKNIQFIETNQNLGFAAGNNYALPYCNGELLSLLNVDTIVDKDWLKELVDAMSLDGKCAAVTSKTLFFERFQDVEISSECDFTVELNQLIESLNYEKYFVRQGQVKDGVIFSTNNKIIFSLPVQNKKINIACSLQKNEVAGFFVKLGKNITNYYKTVREKLDIKIDFSQDALLNASYIINNAGTISKNGMPADRGIGEYDNGQYDNKCYVDFFCGVSVLLRRSAILNRKIFVSEFFAYYEDSELSRWIKRNGYKILYTPRSILYHKHSATSSEGSSLWNLLVARSQLIYNYNGDINKLHNSINHIEDYYKHNINENIYKNLKTFSLILKTRLEQQNNIVETLKPIGIYNSYWNTKGGGESHALAFASALQKKDTVYLISETDFDIQELSKYFNLDLSNCRKIVEPYVTTALTQKFSIFINTTYRSNLESRAEKSFYIVSFPHQDVNKKILDNYIFLYNSDYTKKWAKKYWGNSHSSTIVYPLGMLEKKDSVDLQYKGKYILSVGRFFRGGHSKNQHIIAKAFRNVIEKNKIFSEWQLILIGSLNQENKEDVNYVQELEASLIGTNHKIIVNAEKKLLTENYERSSIYIHASGYGEDSLKKPENLEHFGITPLEAMMSGCYPLVYGDGGPAELLNRLGIGKIYYTLEELEEKLVSIMQKFEEQELVNSELQKVFRSVLVFVNSQNFLNTLEKIIKE